jgi:hypothetical protein
MLVGAGPCWLVRLGSVEEMVEGREKFVPAVLAWLSIVRLRDKAQGGDLLVQPEEIRRVVIP